VLQSLIYGMELAMTAIREKNLKLND
jgi:hypothetical protein